MDKKVAHKPVTLRDVAELGGGGGVTPLVGLGTEGLVVVLGGVAVVDGGGAVVEDGGVADEGGVAVVLPVTLRASFCPAEQ